MEVGATSRVNQGKLCAAQERFSAKVWLQTSTGTHTQSSELAHDSSLYRKRALGVRVTKISLVNLSLVLDSAVQTTLLILFVL